VSGRGPLLAGLILIGLGAFFLLRELVPGVSWSDIWPWASIALGILLIVLSIRPARGSD
jgi:hypothetical protein